MTVKRINVYLEDKTFRLLKELPGTLSENVRSAILSHIEKLKNLNASSSQSRKEGGI
jgi:hypothetical protein